MTRHRIAVIGLGMAVTPHAKSLLDLRGSGRGRLCLQPRARRGAARSRRASTFRPRATSSDRERCLGRCGHDPRAAERASGARPALRRGRQAHPAGEAARAHDRAGAAPGRGGRGGRHQARRRLPAPLSRGFGASARAAAGRGARRARRGQRHLPLVAAAELLRRARARHARARRRRRPDHPGDPHPRSDLEPRRPGRRGRGDHRHDRPAPHGDRGLRRPPACALRTAPTAR